MGTPIAVGKGHCFGLAVFRCLIKSNKEAITIAIIAETTTKSGIGGDSTSEPLLMVGIEVAVGDRDAEAIVGFEVVGGI